MRVVVMGCGTVGARVATQLASQGHRVTAMDSDRQRLDHLTQDLGTEGVLASESLMEAMQQIRMSDVDAFLALSGDENGNLMAAQIATHIFHVPRVICRVEDPERGAVYEELGLEVVCALEGLAVTVQEALGGAI